MITETPIAFGLTLVVCLSLFFYCWYVRKLLRCRRLRANRVQVSAATGAAEVVVQEQAGLERAVVATFPTVKAHELKDDDELQCPICLVEYVDTEVLRELPLCGHVFHIHCVDSWLQKHVTCPVCRIVLTEYHPKPTALSSPTTATIETAPQHLRRQKTSSSHQTLATRDSSEPGDLDTDLELAESPTAAPLQNSPDPAVYLQRSSRPREAHTIAIVQTSACVSHAQRMTKSFSFRVSSTEDGWSSARCFESVGRGWPWRTESSTDVDESATGLSPLTEAPEHCSFEFLPVITGPGGDYSLTDFHR